MKFSRLKILGFKSFCDATELHMEPGLTGVVGPNGCGKSNLVEALRWVMGESSYKAMRASGMDDVIFSGSKNRPSRNSAQVTLLLDNSDRTAPSNFNDVDELEITRRIERDSGSSYRINGKEARARDVQLLFADASTGSKSPALVRQGQIGELIAAKPVKRRALLEEAAGISGLHSRRHEAELKLRAAEQNLERVDDIISQIESQLDNLKRQARLATRYRNVSGDIKKAEATLYHIRWVNARFAQKESEALQGKMINILADATSKQLKADKALKDIDERLVPLRNSEAGASAALQRLKIHKDQLEEEEKRANSSKHELEQRQKQIASDENRESDLIKEANEIIKKYESEQNSLEQENNEEKNIANIAKSEVAKVLASLNEVEKKAQIAANELSQLRANKETAKQALNEASARLSRLNIQASDVANEMKGLNASLNANQAVSQNNALLEKAKEEFLQAEKSSKIAEENTIKSQSELEETRPNLAKLEVNLSTLKSEAATLARVLNVEGASLWPSIVDELNVKQGYEIALGAALGDNLEASSDDGAPLYWTQSADDLNDAKLPKIAEPISKYVSGSKLLERRLNQIGLVSFDDGKKLMKTLKTGQSLVTKKGDFWRWDGFVALADAPTASAQRLSQRNRLRELDDEIEKAKEEYILLQEKNETLAQKLKKARQIEKQEREEWRNCQRIIEKAQNALDIAKKAIANLTTRQSALEEAKSLLSINIKEAQEQEALAKATLEQQIDEAGAINLNETLKKETQALREKAQNAQIHLNGFENAAQLRLARINQIKNENQSWQRRKTGATAQLEILENRSTEIATQLSILKASPDAFATKKQILDEDIDAATTDHKTASDRLEATLTQYKEADRLARSTIEELSKAREELARIEERLKSAITQVQQIEQLTLETLSTPASKAAELANIKPDAPLPQIEMVEKKLDRLKAERERLGGVNLGADKEAIEIKEKFETLLSDKEDLLAAIAKLRTGIFSLNKEGRARLNDAFDKVNSHFKDLFTSLFDGGEAELKFVESDDPLQAGLEIIARPPGKKPQIMSLLSGGEQALTALSLIFAVFLTNPAPICVLDEVDAPLDDANVVRFCNLLDTMNKRVDTRFLIVTHNPITMSRADRLFGVTMAERGVSQLVSVDLQTAQEVTKEV